jgi:hypothetical protein
VHCVHVRVHVCMCMCELTELTLGCSKRISTYKATHSTPRHSACAGVTPCRYPCIVGAGRNAAILHYERNAAVVGPQDLVLVDAGESLPGRVLVEVAGKHKP